MSCLRAKDSSSLLSISQAMATLDEGIRANTSTMPLASRLDHLDFVMKYLGGKQEYLPRFAHNRSIASVQGKKHLVPMSMDAITSENSFKGPLMDRVASLEHRLVQLCLAMDSGSTSPSDTFPVQEHQRKTTRSFHKLSLTGKRAQRQSFVEGPETQEKSEKVKQKLKRRSYLIQPKKKGSQQDEQKSKSQKKRLKNWSRLNFFGC